MKDATPNARSSNHYSYSVYADPKMAATFDAARFGGPIGQLLAETQEQTIANFLAPVEGRDVLDVGTGTGRAALALAARGARVTGVDASSEMLAVARRRATEMGLDVTFAEADAHRMAAFADRSFDAVVCLRVLMHTPGWRQSLAELCRIARTHVVIDYPALVSAAALQAGARRIAAALGVRTEAYRVFTDRTIRSVLDREGFAIMGMHRQFVLPIAVHKRLGSRRTTERVEAGLAGAGLNGLFGSPVTIVAERCASS